MKRKVKVTDFKRFIETVAGKVPIDYLNAGWFFEELSTIDKRYYWYVKRAIDVLLSLFGICVTLPFLPFVALLIKIDSPGPVFYSQSRIGRDNKPFRLWKLRTMVRDADKDNVHWTTNNDARITLVGKFLRKIRLDEVPQLFNILKGDMTLIGPRPEAVSLVELYKKEIPYYLERHMVTPGITGWAQINYPYGNSVEDAREKLKYDYYYIKNRSIVLDANIFLRTIRIVLTGKGAL
jgi:exopolysaccharide biosynthesis polyprenyl glycosylphosphotransferase